MKRKFVKGLILFVVLTSCILVNAGIKCDSGKPGDVVNCAVTDISINGRISNITVDNGLSFDSCDVCNGDDYVISAGTTANFKFKIDAGITESKTLAVSFAGETASIKVVVEEPDEVVDEITYTVTLVPGNNQSNITKSCKVNSLNTTCNVSLDDLNIVGFNGWGQTKECTEGSKGNIKVNKDVTYYACYVTDSLNNDDNETSDNDSNNDSNNLLLKSLVIKNGEEEVDLDFSIRIKEYDIIVPLATESLVVEATPQDENVEVVVSGHEKLEDENSKITITLKDKNNNTNTYIINVTKKDEVKLPLLSNLIVGGYSLDFKPETFVYNLTINKGIKVLNIEPAVDDENFEFKINGNENLKDGSQISIVVTDLNTEATSTYIINIAQESSNLMIYIIIGSILLIVLIVLLIIVVKKGKKSDKNDQNKKVKTPPKGKTVNSKNTIPEVNATPPVTPVAPSAPVVNSPDNQKDDIEVLDL